MRKTCLAVFGLLAAFTFAMAGGTKVAEARIECSLVVDNAGGAVLLREGRCDVRMTPMSTFKVPLALMGFDSGILIGPHDPVWQYGMRFDAPKRAHKPVDPAIWQSESILWYSQELAGKLGKEKFERYVRAFGYGNADISGNRGSDDGLTEAWLSSSLSISPDEQAAFLRRMLNREIPVSAGARALTLSIVPAFQSGGWSIHGKTGSGWARRKDGKPDRSRPVGWFVGWAERAGKTLVFVRLTVGDDRAKEPQGLKLRDEFLRDWPAVSKSY